MTHSRSSSVSTAMLCAGAVTAQFVGGKATRDALFLANLDVTSLPAMVMATSAVSLLLVVANSKGASRISPAKWVPALFTASAVLFVAEWLLVAREPRVAAVLIYLHISGLGPLVGSGFWLISSERFDPRTAKMRFGQIAGAGTLGGVAGGLLAERVAAAFDITAMLLVLAAINIVCAWQVRRLAGQYDASDTRAPKPFSDFAQSPALSGLRVLARAPYLRNLAVLVLLGSTGGALLDYLFKAGAVSTFGKGDVLLRFFAIYYAASSLVTFFVQLTASRSLLERYGLGLTASTPSFAFVAGGLIALLIPGFEVLTLTRGAESVLRSSLFRSGYELFFTPIAPSEKRAAKAIVDVGFDRFGDALGGGAVRIILLMAPAVQYASTLSLGIACSAAAIFVARRLNRGYIHSLEKSLLNRALKLDTSEVEDLTTQTVLLRALGRSFEEFAVPRAEDAEPQAPPLSPAIESTENPELQDIIRLHSRDRDQVLKILAREEGPAPALVPHVIRLLAWGPVSNAAIVALRRVAEKRVGELIDTLIDPGQDFSVRRHMARVFAVCVSQRAADGLLLGLDDQRFEVRFQCARSLTAIVEKNAMIRIDKERVYAVVLREVAVGRSVWDSRRQLDKLDDGESGSFLDEFVRDRASQSLAHIFTLLALVLPREPLRIAFRGLHTDDENLRGTALEYLEGILPQPIRERLWPFIEDRRTATRGGRSRDDILAELLRSNRSIQLNLEELKRRAEARLVDDTGKAASRPVARLDSK